MPEDRAEGGTTPKEKGLSRKPHRTQEPHTTAYARPKGKRCLNPKSDWRSSDLSDAKKVLDLSRTAPETPKLQSTLGYWFARLYAIITDHEIRLAESAKLDHPGFLLRFIPIFYELYYDALNLYLAGKQPPTDWKAHFDYSETEADSSAFQIYLPYVESATLIGVSAHIQHDMKFALRDAYLSYTRAYCLSDPLDAFHRDFFDKNKPTFADVRNEFISEFISRYRLQASNLNLPGWVMDKFGNIKIDTIYEWRQHAWNDAKRMLGQK